MLYNELDVMEYAVTMETEMLDDDALIEAELDEFMEWLYSDDDNNSYNDIVDISKSELWKLCNSNIDANFSTLTLTIFDNCDNTVFQGLAMDYPYDWYDCNIADYHIYNIDNNVYIDVWATFTTWK